MEELIAKMDAEIASIQRELDAVNATVAAKKQAIGRLEQAKHSLAGRGCAGRCVATMPRGPHGATRENIAVLLENNGPMRAGLIAKSLGIHPQTATRVMKQNDWFTMHGARSLATWSLSEAGINRHKK